MKEILVDENGYQQFLEKLNELKIMLSNNAANGSEAYRAAVGDGWHDNFAFEESIRHEREVASNIESMLKDFNLLKVIKRNNHSNDIIDVGDILKIQVEYDKDDIEQYVVKLTGKYLPDSNAEIQEISLNSPIGKAIYLKKTTDKLFYNINNNVVKIKILEKFEKK